MSIGILSQTRPELNGNLVVADTELIADFYSFVTFFAALLSLRVLLLFELKFLAVKVTCHAAFQTTFFGFVDSARTPTEIEKHRTRRCNERWTRCQCTK